MFDCENVFDANQREWQQLMEEKCVSGRAREHVYTIRVQNVTYSVVGEIVTNDVFNSTFDAVGCEDDGKS
jgi:hypothetical protein